MQPTLTDNVDHEGREHHDPTPTSIGGWGLKIAVRFLVCVVLMGGATRAPSGGGSMRHLTVPHQVDAPTSTSLISTSDWTPALSQAN